MFALRRKDPRFSVVTFLNKKYVSKYNKHSISTMSRPTQTKKTEANVNLKYSRKLRYNSGLFGQENKFLKHCSYCQNIHRQSKRDFSTWFEESLQGKLDRYQGIWVDLRQLNTNISESQFETMLEASVSFWREGGLKTVWLEAAIAQGGFLAVASRHGFKFHHAEGQNATLFLNLDPSSESRVPMFASHQVGVSGVVIKEDTKEVLVVQDKGRKYTLWKFPGGLSDLGEDIAKTAEREVFEETGLQTEFQSILAFRQQHDHPGAFGRSDIYILCRLKPLTFDLNPCVEEISACQWMKVEDLKREVHASSITHRMAAIIDLGLKNGWDHVDIRPTQMESIHNKRKLFHMFNRPVS